MQCKYGRSKDDYFKLKQKARHLRKTGKSYREIIHKLKLSKSTVSRWCRDIKLNPPQIEILAKRYDAQLRGAKANQIKRQKEIEIIQKTARKEIEKPNREMFKIAGTMLYWAEGNKTNHLGLTNSDPVMIIFMVNWFEEFLNIKPNQLKVHLQLHGGQDEKKIKYYWSKLTGVPEHRFGKTYIKPEGTGHRKNKLYNGTIRISMYNKNLLYRVLAWIDQYQKYIMSR
jgi:transcriptional regulator with XRE-family HTH domain